MSVKGVTEKCWILALFVRDDGERLLLGGGAYEFKEGQQHFVANSMQNDVVEVQGNDGVLVAGQVRRASTQSFDGFIGDATVPGSDVELYREQFVAFFAKNHFFTVIYIFPNGTAIKRRQGFIVDAPEVQELRQIHPEYHVALNFEDVNYYRYLEDADGQEIYGQMASLWLYNASGGGLVWDEYGTVFDEIGAVWEEGIGGVVTIDNNGIDYTYPKWVVYGPATNPTLVNITTGETLSYSGTVTASQVLTVDMMNQTASLNGVNVLRNISGSWVRLAPGTNRLEFVADNVDAPNSDLSWPEVVG